jgi:hypothetical protein
MLKEVYPSCGNQATFRVFQYEMSLKGTPWFQHGVLLQERGKCELQPLK